MSVNREIKLIFDVDGPIVDPHLSSWILLVKVFCELRKLDEEIIRQKLSQLSLAYRKLQLSHKDQAAVDKAKQTFFEVFTDQSGKKLTKKEMPEVLAQIKFTDRALSVIGELAEVASQMAFISGTFIDCIVYLRDLIAAGDRFTNFEDRFFFVGNYQFNWDEETGEVADIIFNPDIPGWKLAQLKQVLSQSQTNRVIFIIAHSQDELPLFEYSNGNTQVVKIALGLQGISLDPKIASKADYTIRHIDELPFIVQSVLSRLPQES